MGGDNKGWPAVGPLIDTKPAPIRLAAMSDARKLAWNDAAKVPFPIDRIIWLAVRHSRLHHWIMVRAIWDKDHSIWVDPEAPSVRYSAKLASHWHEDTMGTP